METRQTKKRKSPLKDFIGDLCDDDLSPDDASPDRKIVRLDGPDNLEIASKLDCSDSIQDTASAEMLEIEGHSTTEGCTKDLDANQEIVVAETLSTNLEMDPKLPNSDTIKDTTGTQMVQLVGNNTTEACTKDLDVQKPEIVVVEAKLTKVPDLDSRHVPNDIQISEKHVETPKVQINEVQDSELSQNPLIEPTITSQLAQSEPCIQIKFANHTISELYKAKLVQILQNFVEFEVKTTDCSLQMDVYRDQSICPSEWLVLDETLCQSLVHESMDNLHKKDRKKKAKKCKELYIVDPNPSDCTESVKYDSKFSLIEAKEPEIKAQNAIQCFNCDGAHQLRDCPIPKDYTRINEVRKQRFAPKASRYHLEEDQKYAHLQPGQISLNLQNALNLHPNQIPQHVYLMRKFGYPPGWLEEAKEVYSNLDIFDIDGNKSRKGNKRRTNSTLNKDKIIDYAGFNVQMPENTIDEYRKYQVPQMSTDFSKDKMLDYFEQQFGTETIDLSECSDSETIDCPNDQSLTTSVQLFDASLNTLEQHKLDILNELNGSTNVPIDESALEMEGDCVLSTVRDTKFGTPILKSSSPYVRLPHSDNFSRDVSPVINFENLPNSTGKYEQMSGVIQKVRQTLKSMSKA